MSKLNEINTDIIENNSRKIKPFCLPVFKQTSNQFQQNTDHISSNLHWVHYVLYIRIKQLVLTTVM